MSHGHLSWAGSPGLELRPQSLVAHVLTSVLGRRAGKFCTSFVLVSYIGFQNYPNGQNFLWPCTWYLSVSWPTAQSTSLLHSQVPLIVFYFNMVAYMQYSEVYWVSYTVRCELQKRETNLDGSRNLPLKKPLYPGTYSSGRERVRVLRLRSMYHLIILEEEGNSTFPSSFFSLKTKICLYNLTITLASVVNMLAPIAW